MTDEPDLDPLAPPAALDETPLTEIPTEELLKHVRRPAGPLHVGDRRSDRTLAKYMAALMILTFAVLVYIAVAQTMLLRAHY